jgi:gamma-glutamyl-gamma-aminobutyrate hydrolase PuuD
MLDAAFLRGCPILAVCDGTLVIWELKSGTTASVLHHSYNRMPAITQTGKIGYNMTMHRLRIRQGSLLEVAMAGKDKNTRISNCTAPDNSSQAKPPP